jgi:hypothetical protein
MVLTHCWIEVEFAFNLIVFHHCIVVLVANFFLHKAVPPVFFSVCGHIASVLSLYPGEIEDFSLFLLCLCVSPDLTPMGVLGLVGRREDTRSKVLGVQDPDLLLVY